MSKYKCGAIACPINLSRPQLDCLDCLFSIEFFHSECSPDWLLDFQELQRCVDDAIVPIVGTAPVAAVSGSSPRACHVC